MKRRRPDCRTLLLAALLAVAPAAAQQWQAAQLPLAEETLLVSQINRSDYRIQTAAIGTAPAGGYPVLYLLDGDQYFPYALSLAQSLLRRPDSREQPPLLLVGIGYGAEQFLHRDKRERDLTPPPRPQAVLASGGGGEAFAEVIDREIKPLIAGRYPVDSQAQTLFGHSYGGLFAAYYLHTRRSGFQRYYLSSPSLWWDGRRMEDFAAHLAEPGPRPEVMISAGEAEQAKPQDSRRRERAMIGNAEALAQRLCEAQYPVTFQLLPGENHGSAAFAALNRLLREMGSQP